MGCLFITKCRFRTNKSDLGYKIVCVFEKERVIRLALSHVTYILLQLFLLDRSENRNCLSLLFNFQSQLAHWGFLVLLIGPIIWFTCDSSKLFQTARLAETFQTSWHWASILAQPGLRSENFIMFRVVEMTPK